MKVRIKLIGNQMVYYRRKDDKIVELLGVINEEEAQLSRTPVKDWNVEDSSFLLEKLERIGSAIKEYGVEENEE